MEKQYMKINDLESKISSLGLTSKEANIRYTKIEDRDQNRKREDLRNAMSKFGVPGGEILKTNLLKRKKLLQELSKRSKSKLVEKEKDNEMGGSLQLMYGSLYRHSTSHSRNKTPNVTDSPLFAKVTSGAGRLDQKRSSDIFERYEKSINGYTSYDLSATKNKRDSIKSRYKTLFEASSKNSSKSKGRISTDGASISKYKEKLTNLRSYDMRKTKNGEFSKHFINNYKILNTPIKYPLNKEESPDIFLGVRLEQNVKK